MMVRKLLALMALAAFVLVATPEKAPAQDASREIAETLSRLKNNPRYRGRVLGTHLRRDGRDVLYEVRILRRRDDRVILVYIDPETGGVVGDSERSRGFSKPDRKPSFDGPRRPGKKPRGVDKRPRKPRGNWR